MAKVQGESMFFRPDIRQFQRLNLEGLRGEGHPPTSYLKGGEVKSSGAPGHRCAHAKLLPHSSTYLPLEVVSSEALKVFAPLSSTFPPLCPGPSAHKTAEAFVLGSLGGEILPLSQV